MIEYAFEIRTQTQPELTIENDLSQSKPKNRALIEYKFRRSDSILLCLSFSILLFLVRLIKIVWSSANFNNSIISNP